MQMQHCDGNSDEWGCESAFSENGSVHTHPSITFIFKIKQTLRAVQQVRLCCKLCTLSSASEGDALQFPETPRSLSSMPPCSVNSIYLTPPSGEEDDASHHCKEVDATVYDVGCENQDSRYCTAVYDHITLADVGGGSHGKEVDDQDEDQRAGDSIAYEADPA